MKARIFGTCLIVCSSLWGFSCATPSSTRGLNPTGTGATGNSGPSVVTAQETSDFQEIQTLYSHSAFETVQAKTTVFERKYKKSPQLAQIRNLHGLALLLSQQPLKAVGQFRKALELSSNELFNQFVLFNLGTAQFEANQTTEAQTTFNVIRSDLLDKDVQIKFHATRAKLEMKLGHPEDAARHILTIGRLGDVPESKNFFATLLDQALTGIKDPQALEKLYSDFEDSPYGDLVLYGLGSLEMKSGKSKMAEPHLKLLISRYPQSTHYAAATDLLKSIQDRTVVEPKSVGVLLPLKGKFARFGTRSLQAIELAFKIFNTREPDTQISLVLQDSGEDAETAVKGLNELYFQHHVIGVIGPLLSKGVDQVTQRAQELGLPLISLAQQPGSVGEFVFQSSLTPKMQATGVARYAIEELNLHRFAILYPKDKFGEQFSQAFWDAVDQYGGEITGIESYTPGDTDFRGVVDRISGMHYLEARQRELDALAEERKKENIKKKTRKNEQFFNLKPIVDYEAVFIPDEPKSVGQILPTFAYRDVDGIRFLGISTWHSPELITRAQNYAEGAVFGDSFFPESGSPQVKAFVSHYKSTFNQDPTAIEALAYDAAHILEEELVHGGASNREDLKMKLQGVTNFQGVTGKISYKDGVFNRNIALLSVRGGKIIEVK